MNIKSEKGFTLLEVLVVLLLTTFIATLLAQGFTHAIGLRSSFLSQMETQRTSILQEHWFRNVCMALIPDLPKSADPFSGNEHKLYGLSLSPLTRPAGVPTPVSFTIEHRSGKIVLLYRESEGASLEIGQWKAENGAFLYLDQKGNWHGKWPPRALESFTQMPDAIMLHIKGVVKHMVWCVNLPGRHEPRPNLQEL